MAYTAQAATAQRMITAKGTSAVITQKSIAVRDVVNQTSLPSTRLTQTVSVVILPATTSRDQTLDERTLVRKNSRLLYLSPKQVDGSALAFEIADGQTIAIEGGMWELRGVSGLAPDGGAPVLYTAEAFR